MTTVRLRAHAPSLGAAGGGRPPREVAAVWLLAAVPLVAVFATYARLPAGLLYNVSGGGVSGGASRALVEVNFPVALIALAVLAVVSGRLPPAARWAAVVAACCCAVFAVPGVLRQSNLDARWINAVPAAGVALAFACSWLARGPESPRRARGDRLRLALAAALVLLAAPWIAAELGFYLDGVPVLGRVFQTGRLVALHDTAHPAVHHGVHHGLQGVLLVVTALLLSRLLDGTRRPAEQARALLLSLVLAYGLGNVANDAWLEQVAERGWSGYAIPSVLEPAANWLWLVVLGVALLTWLTWFGRPTERARRGPATREGAGTRSPRCGLPGERRRSLRMSSRPRRFR